MFSYKQSAFPFFQTLKNMGSTLDLLGEKVGRKKKYIVFFVGFFLAHKVVG